MYCKPERYARSATALTRTNTRQYQQIKTHVAHTLPSSFRRNTTPHKPIAFAIKYCFKSRRPGNGVWTPPQNRHDAECNTCVQRKKTFFSDRCNIAQQKDTTTQDSRNDKIYLISLPNFWSSRIALTARMAPRSIFYLLANLPTPRVEERGGGATDRPPSLATS